MSLESRIFVSMVAFIQETHRAAERALQDSGISPAQFFILNHVRAHAGSSQVDLADALGVTAGNVSQLVGKLERARLVARAGQGRAKLVTLTASGQRLVADLGPHHDAFLRSRFAGLKETERRTLDRLLQTLSSPTSPSEGPRSEPRRRAARARR